MTTVTAWSPLSLVKYVEYIYIYKTFVTTQRPWMYIYIYIYVLSTPATESLSTLSLSYFWCDFDLLNRWGTTIHFREERVLSSGVHGESTQSTLKIFEGRNKICSCFLFFNVIFNTNFTPQVFISRGGHYIWDQWIFGFITWGGPCCCIT